MVFSFTGKPKKKQETSINNYSFLGVRLTPGLARTLLMVIALPAGEALSNVRGCIENLLQLRVSVSRREISEDTDSTLRGSSE